MWDLSSKFPIMMLQVGSLVDLGILSLGGFSWIDTGIRLYFFSNNS
jgi:hypothetical protein